MHITEVEVVMDPTNIVFFKVWNEMALTPNGYRLATLHEVRNHSKDIKDRGIQSLEEKQHIGYKEQKMCLLDGYITYPTEEDFEKQETFAECEWRVVVEKKSEGDVLRKKLYQDIHVSLQGKEIAFLNATRHGDTEVIYWVLTTTNPTDRQRLKHLMDNNKEFLANASPYYVYMVRRLVSSGFSSPPLEKGGRNTVVDFAVEYAATSYENERENTIAVAELLIEMYSPDIVDKEIFYSVINRSEPYTTEKEPECDILKPIVFTHVETMPLFPGLETMPLFPGLENKKIIRKENIIAYEKSYLYKAAAKAQREEKCIPMLTMLLSKLPELLHNHGVVIRPLFGEVCMEALTIGYGIVEKMLQFKEYIAEMRTGLFVELLGRIISKKSVDCVNILLTVRSTEVGSEPGDLRGEEDSDGKTFLHYAAEMGIVDIFKLVHDGTVDRRIVGKRDKFRRSILHLASLHGQSEFCKTCISDWMLKVEDTDSSLRNSLHFAVKGIKGNKSLDVLDVLISLCSSPIKLINSQDYKGRTSLHLASEQGNTEMIEKLLNPLKNDTSRMKKYIQKTDFFRRTALHVASHQGDQEIVRLLLENGSDPLNERDIDGKTSLHYAAQAKDPEAALGICKLLLNKYEGSRDKQSLLLSASSIVTGTADEGEGVNYEVKRFLEKRREATEDQNLLRLAAIHEDVEMVWELLDRGADIKSLYDKEWQKNLRESQPTALQPITNVIHQIEAMKGHGRDQPTMEDYLGRDVYADGIAALFLNRFIESPITLGISGQWGMGKSSVMIQTQKILLITAAKLAFPNIFPVEKGKDKKIGLTKEGRKVYEKVKMGANNMLQRRNHKKGKGRIGAKSLLREGPHRDNNPLVNMLNEYNPQDDDVYKSLACMDIQQVVDYNSQNKFSHAFSEIPRILTIKYNAWHYRNEVEAWAGLAVTITKAIEVSMTRSQRYSAAWRYSWKRNRLEICIQVFLPSLVAAFIAVCVSLILLLLIRQGKFEKLKYGSIPLTILATVCVFVQKVVSIVKPVSTQMMGYITSPDHTSRLGYQAEVISDIKFLKQEIGRKPNPLFSIITGDWHCFKLYPDNVENTSFPKLQPASEDSLRIITFVDDLDRCEEKVILEVLSAINLVLAECKIDVILGMDMEMITRAISSNYRNSKDRYLAEKFISKIVQIPLSLPDPTEEELDNFLGHELGLKLQKAEFDVEDTDGEQEPKTNRENENASTTQECIVDMPGCCGLQTRCPNTVYAGIKKVYGVFFNIAMRLKFWKAQADDEKTEDFSEGARLVRRTLLSNFTREEVDTINKLKSFATGNRKLPREWKRLLHYYKLAFNILSRRGEVYSLSRWKEELVAWVFVCWQWQQQMNTLIKDWRRYVFATSYNLQDGNNTNWDHWSGPSLKDIVTYIKEYQKSAKPEEGSTAESSDAMEVRGSLRGSNSIDVLKLRGSLRPSNATTCLYENSEDSDEEASSLQTWDKLQEALGIQDVSMKGIKLFQQFRFYCETDHLPWPLPEETARA